MKIKKEGLKRIIKEEFKKIMEGLDIEFMESVADQIKSRGPRGINVRYIPTKRKDPKRALLKISTSDAMYEVLLTVVDENEIQGKFFDSSGNKVSEFVSSKSEIVENVLSFLEN